MTSIPAYAAVTVPVTALWVGPDRPREVDAAIVATTPDLVRWLAAMDAHPDDDESGDGRLGLHGRIESELVDGEPVIVVGSDASGDWTEVLCPWQPTPRNADGYPGWVPTAHLRPTDSAPDPPVATADAAAVDGDHPAVVLAREHLGLSYLWGGVTPPGFDCSGLVHHTWRRFGHIVPRDSWAMATAAEPVSLDAVRPGDLYFFAHAGRRIHHVGIVVSPSTMIHASETGVAVVEEALHRDRLDTLVAAGRLVAP